MSDMYTEWSRLQMALRHHVESGRSVRSLARESGVSAPTLLEWIQRIAPPETIAAAQAVIMALKRRKDGENDH